MSMEKTQTPLLELISAASAGPDFARAGALNRGLRRVRAQGTFELAEAIAAFLESPVAILLYDEQGASCHQEAVETLLSFGRGFQHLVPPRELSRARRRLSKPELQALRRSRQQAASLLAAGAISAVSLSAWFVWQHGGAPGLALSALIAAGLSIASLATLLRALPVPRAHRGPAALLVLAGALSFAGCLQASWDPLGLGLLSALAAAGLALVVLTSWRDPLES